MTQLPLPEDEVHTLLELDPAVPTEAADIEAVRAVVARLPTLPPELVFGPLIDEWLRKHR